MYATDFEYTLSRSQTAEQIHAYLLSPNSYFYMIYTKLECRQSRPHAQPAPVLNTRT